MKRVFALITVFNPSNFVLNNVKSIANQVDLVFICDNSAICNLLIFKELENIKYYWTGKNYGLSVAFNKAIKENIDKINDDDYLIFFDQDSSIKFNHIDQLICEYEKIEKQGVRIGCLGPVFFNVNSGKVEIPLRKKEISEKIYNVPNIITSSMITKFSILKKIGYWNEKIFLDFVDWDYCWRLKKFGFSCVLTENVILTHQLGIGEKKIWFIRVRVGAAIREYYQTRDACYLILCNYVPFKMRIRLLLNLTIRPFAHILFLNDKRERLHYIWRGFVDAFNGVRGEYKIV